jgi:Tol biopolymer transport system component
MSFWAELRKRHVFKVGAAYAVVAWLLAQAASLIEAPLNLPTWFDTAVIVLLVLGFPVALTLAWAYDLAPAGLEHAADAAQSGVAGQGSAHSVDYRLIALLSLAVLVLTGGGVFFVIQKAHQPRPLALRYSQLTNFTDSAVAPSLSHDGRMLAFIRGASTFVGPGDVYVKLLPDGDPVQLTHDGSPKMGPTVFSPDGTRVVYSVGIEEAWTVPVLGGDPSRLLPKAGGLTWAGVEPTTRRVLFSKLLGAGLHMGLFTSFEDRADERAVYAPSDVNGMAHRSAASPSQDWVLTAEMDLGGWLPCRLVPFDGASQGRVVGPAPAQCTDVAWSPDGEWMYFSADAGDGFHIWRQRFPDGAPEQVTFGATEEQGIAFARDGRSFVTSIGESRSAIWIHDDRGVRQLTSQGYAFLPAFSADQRSLYYLRRSLTNRRFVNGELWVTDIESGRRERLLPGLLMEHYSIAQDGKHVVCVSIDEDGRSEVWLATLDNSAAPRRLAVFDVVVRAMIDPQGGVFFVGGERGSLFLYHLETDGSDLRKVLPQPMMFLYAVSPDGRFLSVWEPGDAASATSPSVLSDAALHDFADVDLGNVSVYSRDGRTRVIVCAGCGTAGGENRGITPPLLSWSSDGRFVYFHSARETQLTYALRLEEGEALPAIPPTGLSSMEEAARLAGVEPISEPRAFAGVDPSVYAFARVATVRNIYRITLQ